MKKYLNSIKLQPQVIAIIFIEITFAIVTLLEVFANTINVTRDITAPPIKYGKSSQMWMAKKNISENESRLKVLWDIDLSGNPIIGRGFAENGIKQTTEDALCLYRYRITT